MANNSMLYSLKVGAFVARVIPRKIGSRLSFRIGYMYGLLPTSTQKRIISIHKKVSPELSNKALKKRAAGVLGSYALYWWDVFWMSSPRKKEEMAPIIDVESIAYFNDALEKSQDSGTGIILALPHMGSWEIAGSWLAVLGHSPVVVAERLKPPELFELFSATRTKAGMTVIAHDDHPTSKLMSALKQGRAICLVADRDISKRGILVDFFGIKKSMPTGPAALAIKTGAIIVPVCVYVSHDSRLTVTFSPTIDVHQMDSTFTKEETIEHITSKLTSTFEKMISRDPTQWHVLHDEWEKS